MPVTIYHNLQFPDVVRSFYISTLAAVNAGEQKQSMVIPGLVRVDNPGRLGTSTISSEKKNCAKYIFQSCIKQGLWLRRVEIDVELQI